MSEPHIVSEPSSEKWCENCNRPRSRCLCRSPQTLARKVFKTGVQTLYQTGFGAGRRYWVRLDNRTNHTTVEIPFEKVSIWTKILRERN